MPSIAIRRITSLDDPQLPAACDVMTEAFKSVADPLLVAMTGGDLSLSQASLKGYIGGAIVEGETYFAEQDGDVVGISCWFPPGNEILATEKQQDAGWNEYLGKLSQAGRDWQNEIHPRLGALYSSSLPTPTAKVDDYHLTLLGVHPALQRRGIGAKLIKEGIDRAEKLGVNVSLDANTDAAVSVYKKLGFRVAGAGELPSPWGDFTSYILVWQHGVNVWPQSTLKGVSLIREARCTLQDISVQTFCRW
ncbi:hypothetical protein K439DRAFT_1663856 [Ramaria rubella]|nr:hypothetical protein K439DRAFT_1663856 [Ramaria rubella]